MWETIGSNYLEAVSKALPIHRAILFVLGTLSSILAKDTDCVSLIYSVLSFKLKILTSLDAEIYSQLSITNLLSGCIVVILSIFASKIFLLFIFKGISRLVDYKKLVNDAQNKNPFKAGLSLEERKATIDFLDTSTAPVRRQLQLFNVLAEIFCGLGFIFLVGFWWGNYVDLIASSLFFLGFLLTHLFSIHYFLSKYLPTAITKSQLLGQSPPDISDLN